jgi:hypothetical protein
MARIRSAEKRESRGSRLSAKRYFGRVFDEDDPTQKVLIFIVPGAPNHPTYWFSFVRLVA